MTVPKPNPGSDEAIAIGCTCAVLDNGHGRGSGMMIDGKPAFWINGDCKVHNKTIAKAPKLPTVVGE